MLQDPQSNVQNVQVYPAKYRGQLIFPYGVTMLTYVATNEVGVTANCSMDINVRGRLVARTQAKINFDLSVKKWYIKKFRNRLLQREQVSLQ